MPTVSFLILRDFWEILANFGVRHSRCRAALLMLAGAGCTLGQSTLALSSATAGTGATATLNLSLNAPTIQPAALEWTLSFSTADFAAVNVTAGPAATAAGKLMSCTTGAGSFNCLLAGMNDSTIASGVVATVTVTVASSTADTSSLIQVLSPSASNAAGNLLAITATGGTVTINQPTNQTYAITALVCAPNRLATPGSAVCTATVSAPAPSEGLTLATGVASGGLELTVPASASVAPGATATTFSANASAVNTGTVSTVVASLNTTSQRASLQLVPISVIKEILCSPNKIFSNGVSTCTVELENAAPNSGTTVSIGLRNSAPLTVPATATVPAGSSTTTFPIQAGAITTKQEAYLTATLNGRTANFGVILAVGNP
jgi:hypothetical protein